MTQPTLQPMAELIHQEEGYYLFFFKEQPPIVSYYRDRVTYALSPWQERQTIGWVCAKSLQAAVTPSQS